MIRNDTELRVTLQQLARMYESLAALERDRPRLSDAWFAVMSEGPLDQIRRMEADLREYTGRAVAEEAEAPLWLGVRGAGIDWPATPTSVLTTFLNTLRKGIQSGTEWIATGSLSTRPTLAIQRACDLEVLSLRPGSVRVGLRLPEREDADAGSVAGAAREALDKYATVAAWAGSDEDEGALARRVPDAGLRRVLLTEVKRLAPRPRGGVDAVELSGPSAGGRPVSLTRAAHRRIDAAIDAAASEVVLTYAGDLREIDLDNLSFTLRNVGDAALEVPCGFEPELLDTAIEALDRRVEVHGVRRAGGGRRTGRLQVTRLVILDDESQPATEDPG
ncbi:hypothetical protein L6R50_08535 [Myxococcota bacterium]|nr:hypothetical protein [Myxococcota bacterium]